MALVDRTGASSLIREDYARGIIKNATQMSAAMQLFQRRRMSSKQQRMSVIATKPTASFVTGSDTDVGLKALSSMTWESKYLNAEPIAAIVPIAEDLLEDQEYDIWGEVKPELEEAIAATIDAAVFFGTGAPSTWPTAVVTAAVAAGNTVNAGTGVDLAADLNTAMGTVEADGFIPDGWYFALTEMATLRGLRDANRQFLFMRSGPANTGVQNAGLERDRRRDRMGYQGEIYGLEAYTSALGLSGFASVSGNARYVTGDFDQGIIGVRSDIRYQILREATLFNSDGSVAYALAQQDMVALRVVMRVAFQVPNPPTRMQSVTASRYPFAVVRVP
jgi:hypothetical protein